MQHTAAPEDMREQSRTINNAARKDKQTPGPAGRWPVVQTVVQYGCSIRAWIATHLTAQLEVHQDNADFRARDDQDEHHKRQESEDIVELVQPH